MEKYSVITRKNQNWEYFCHTRKTTTETEVTRMPSGEITGSKSESVEEDL